MLNFRRKVLLVVLLALSFMLLKRYFRKRTDVITMTDWLAPVIWEGTFSREALRKHYHTQNLTVGLAVLAVGRIADKYLEMFLQSANRHFMAGYRVIIYVMTESHRMAPGTNVKAARSFQVFTIPDDIWWHDPDIVRMKTLGKHIVEHIQHEVDFLFSMTASQIFQNDFGVEALGLRVAQLHAWWYFKDAKDFPYERRPTSTACIPFGQGDFYYDGALVGGTPLEFLDLIDVYLNGVANDFQKGLNSSYESHLNKYFLLNKPTKLLSPEYNWDSSFFPPPQVQYIKVAQHSRRRV
ncbi:putative glycosyltransferase 6 domain-containing protein 1 isoform X2 [Erinaceus europaeus]|uniref:Glycosyltransferase 6 domain-containing protein 1 isoform X2 n=1 Tax=Erinaceus europaeus TaxID=9365 RepID=A0ABM3Y1F7_ERIEU|nr:putative glycosyltransferase 6 domain-containing protein 1 isoform X2 [Erinaceus europaeus]